MNGEWAVVLACWLLFVVVALLLARWLALVPLSSDVIFQESPLTFLFYKKRIELF
jgi:hypothetical protein